MAIDFGLINRMIQERGEQVPQASDPGARRRMAEAEALRQRRLRQDQVNAELAQRKLEAVQATDPETARVIGRQDSAARMNDPRRYGNSPVPEPSNSLPGESSRHGAYDAYGAYLKKLKSSTQWNDAVHSYKLPLPTINVNPVADDFRQITHDPYYGVHPQEALRYSTPDGSNYSKNFDTTYMGDNPILSKNPVYTDRDMYGRSIPVRIGAQDPFELSPSPYSLSEFAKSMRSRIRGH